MWNFVGKIRRLFLKFQNLLKVHCIPASAAYYPEGMSLYIAGKYRKILQLRGCWEKTDRFAAKEFRADVVKSPVAGMKLVRKESRPISSDTGLKDIEERVLRGDFPAMASQKGAVEQIDIMLPGVIRWPSWRKL